MMPDDITANMFNDKLFLLIFYMMMASFTVNMQSKV